MHTPLRSSRLSTSSSSSNTPNRSSTPTHSTFESKRAFQSLARGNPSTPVGRLLASEGYTTTSPAGVSRGSPGRRIRQKSLPNKAKDYISSRILSLETSFQILSFDSLGYPISISLNFLHFLIRLPYFYSALPSISTIFSSNDSPFERTSSMRYSQQLSRLNDADARLAALQQQGNSGITRGSIGWWGWMFSLMMVLISLMNAVYLVSRRRKYQLLLRKDPLSSPNAKSATLRFSPSNSPAHRPSMTQKIKKWIWPKSRSGGGEGEEEEHSYPIQELNVWTPDYVLWSLRIFTGYPPPVAIMYHFLSPSTFFPFLFIGPSLVFLIFTLIHLYTTLLHDRQLLSSETMHEYNSTFVYPKLFKMKRDVGVGTEELEFMEWKKERYEVDSHARGSAGEGVGEEGRKSTSMRRRTIQGERDSPNTTTATMTTENHSPVPKRRRRPTDMLA